MDPIPMSPPIGGVNELLPVIALESPQCQNLFNFNPNAAGVSVRNGDSFYAKIVNGASFAEQRMSGMFSYGDTQLYVMIMDDISDLISLYSVGLGTVVITHAELFSGNRPSYGVYFNQRLFIFWRSSNPLYYGFVVDSSGTAGAIGYTSATSLGFLGGNSFNHRIYLIEYASASYHYGGVDLISGPLTEVDLSTITEEPSNLAIIASFTLSDQVSSVTIQSFVFFNGEVLFYTGAYPDSTDWTQVGTGRVGNPLVVGDSLSYQGDSLIYCDSGVVSLRDLFLKGSQEAASLTVNSRIQKTWKDLVAAIRLVTNQPSGPILPTSASIVNGVFDSVKNRIIISFPYYLDTAGVAQRGSFYFVFDALRQAWFYHRSYGIFDDVADIIYYKNKVLGITSNVTTTTTIFQKEGATGFTDRNAADSGETAYEYEIVSAPLANGRSFVQQIAGMDIVQKTDLEAQTNYKFIKDFGVSETTNQKIPTVGTSGSLQKPFMNAGIDGSYVQYKISGTTTTGKTVGLQIYGTNTWIQGGRAPR